MATFRTDFDINVINADDLERLKNLQEELRLKTKEFTADLIKAQKAGVDVNRSRRTLADVNKIVTKSFQDLNKVQGQLNKNQKELTKISGDLATRERELSDALKQQQINAQRLLEIDRQRANIRRRIGRIETRRETGQVNVKDLSRLKELRAETEKLNAIRAKGVSTRKQDRQAVAGIRAEVDKLRVAEKGATVEAERLTAQQQQLRKVFKDVAGSGRELKNALQRVNTRKLEQARKVAKELNERFRTMVTTLKSASRSFTTFQGLTNLLRNTLFVTRELIRAFTLFFRSVINVGVQFEESLTRVRVTAELTRQEFEELEVLTRELAKTSVFTARQIADTQVILAQAGLNAQQIFEATIVSVQVAASTLADLNTVTGLTTSSIRTFNLSLRDIGDTADIFSFAVTSSKLTIESLTQAFKFGGIAGASFKFTLEETVTALAEFANIGLAGSTTGTTFRQALNFLTRQTDRSRQAFKTLIPTLKTVNAEGDKTRLTFKDINPEMNNFADITQKLAKFQLSAAQAVAIFGQRAGAAIKNVVDRVRIGAVDLQEFTARLILAEETDIAQERFKELQKTFSAQIKILKSAFQELALSIFETIGPSFEKLLQTGASVLNSFADAIAARDVPFPIADSVAAFFTSLSDNKDLIQEVIDTVFKLGSAVFEFGKIIGSAILFIVRFHKELFILFGVFQLLRIVQFIGTLFVGFNAILASGVLTTIKASGATKGLAVANTFLGASFGKVALGVKFITASIARLVTTLTISTGGLFALVLAVGAVVAAITLWFTRTKEVTDETDKNTKAVQGNVKQTDLQIENLRRLSRELGITIKSQRELNELIATGAISELGGTGIQTFFRLPAGTTDELRKAGIELAAISRIAELKGSDFAKEFKFVTNEVSNLENASKKAVKELQDFGNTNQQLGRISNNFATQIAKLRKGFTVLGNAVGEDQRKGVNKFLKQLADNVSNSRGKIVQLSREFNVLADVNADKKLENINKFTKELNRTLGIDLVNVAKITGQTIESLAETIAAAGEKFTEIFVDTAIAIEGSRIGELIREISTAAEGAILRLTEVIKSRGIIGRADFVEQVSKEVGKLADAQVVLQNNIKNINDEIKIQAQLLADNVKAEKDNTVVQAELLFLRRLQSSLTDKQVELNKKINDITSNTVDILNREGALALRRLFLGLALLKAREEESKSLKEQAKAQLELLQNTGLLSDEIKIINDIQSQNIREESIKREISLLKQEIVLEKQLLGETNKVLLAQFNGNEQLQRLFKDITEGRTTFVQANQDLIRGEEILVQIEQRSLELRKEGLGINASRIEAVKEITKNDERLLNLAKQAQTVTKEDLTLIGNVNKLLTRIITKRTEINNKERESISNSIKLVEQINKTVAENEKLALTVETTNQILQNNAETQDVINTLQRTFGENASEGVAIINDLNQSQNKVLESQSQIAEIEIELNRLSTQRSANLLQEEDIINKLQQGRFSILQITQQTSLEELQSLAARNDLNEETVRFLNQIILLRTTDKNILLEINGLLNDQNKEEQNINKTLQDRAQSSRESRQEVERSLAQLQGGDLAVARENQRAIKATADARVQGLNESISRETESIQKSKEKVRLLEDQSSEIQTQIDLLNTRAQTANIFGDKESANKFIAEAGTKTQQRGNVERQKSRVLTEISTRSEIVRNNEIEKQEVGIKAQKESLREVGKEINSAADLSDAFASGIKGAALEIARASTFAGELKNVITAIVSEFTKRITTTAVDFITGLTQAEDALDAFRQEREDEGRARERANINKRANDSILQAEQQFQNQLSSIREQSTESLRSIEERFNERFREFQGERIQAEIEFFELRRELREDFTSDEEERLTLQEELQRAIFEAQITTGDAQRVRLEEAKALTKELGTVEKQLGFTREQREQGSLSFLDQVKALQDSNFNDRAQQIANERRNEIVDEQRKRQQAIRDAAEERQRTIDAANLQRDLDLAEFDRKIKLLEEEKKLIEKITSIQESFGRFVIQQLIGSAIRLGISTLIGLPLKEGGIVDFQKKTKGGFLDFQKKARGGQLIRGGGGQIDDIYSMLPQGSFIVNKKSTDKHRAELNRMALGFDSGGMVPTRVTNGEFFLSPEIFARNAMRLLHINSDKKQEGGIVSGGSSVTNQTTRNVDNRRQFNITIDARGSSPSEDDVRELYENSLRDLILDDIENKELTFE